MPYIGRYERTYRRVIDQIERCYSLDCRLSYERQRKVEKVKLSPEPPRLTDSAHKALQLALRSRPGRGQVQTLFVSKQGHLVSLCLHQGYGSPHNQCNRRNWRSTLSHTNMHTVTEAGVLVVMVWTTVKVMSRRADRLIEVTADHEH